MALFLLKTTIGNRTTLHSIVTILNLPVILRNVFAIELFAQTHYFNNSK